MSELLSNALLLQLDLDFSGGRSYGTKKTYVEIHRGLLRLMRTLDEKPQNPPSLTRPSQPTSFHRRHMAWRLWLISWPVALQPPICLVPLHQNTISEISTMADSEATLDMLAARWPPVNEVFYGRRDGAKITKKKRPREIKRKKQS